MNSNRWWRVAFQESIFGSKERQRSTILCCEGGKEDWCCEQEHDGTGWGANFKAGLLYSPIFYYAHSSWIKETMV